MSTKTYDVIIIGGGIMGSATAYYLTKADPTLKVAVVERDPDLCPGLNHAFHEQCPDPIQPERRNIQISQYAFAVLETIRR